MPLTLLPAPWIQKAIYTSVMNYIRVWGYDLHVDLQKTFPELYG
jgi:hypothetical protein